MSSSVASVALSVDWSTIGIGVASFIALVFASWCVGEGGEILGAKFDASIVGGLIIAWLNTAPEAIFFIQGLSCDGFHSLSAHSTVTTLNSPFFFSTLLFSSSLLFVFGTALNAGQPKFAMGAVSGSAIVVCTVAVGACVWIGSSARRSGNFALLPSVKRQCQVLAVSTMFPLFSAAFGFSSLWGACAFLFYAAFLVQTIYGSKQEEAGDAKKKDLETGHPQKESNGSSGEEVEVMEDEEEDEHANASVLKGVGFLVVGGGLIFLCSSPFIAAVVHASELLKVSPSLLAFFLAPVASEMPEILEAISLSRRGHVQTINVAYSNLIGGTITKTTLMVGLFSIFGVWRGFVWESPNYSFSLTLLASCALLAAGTGWLPSKLEARNGLLLWGSFVTVALIQYFLNVSA